MSKFIETDFSNALKIEGVVGHVDVTDIPHKSKIGHYDDVPVFVQDVISYHGQPLAAIGKLEATSTINIVPLFPENN